MWSNADKLLTLCSFYNEATLEDDMAKRIMLSIIPSLMSNTEKYYTGGFDYKVLKSAVNGAKDLVKYGTRACEEEMRHYGAGIIEMYNDLKNKRITDITDEEYERIKVLKIRYEGIAKKKNAAKELERDGRYKDSLKLMTDAFNEEDAWETSYGGKAWAKISHTLYQIEEKRELLNLIRQEARSATQDPKTDYPTLEQEVMRDIVVLMNVFDGLAHNTASVMPKVVEQEIQDMRRIMPEDEEDRVEFNTKQYQKRIKNLMDSKEIDDPYTVYKEVQSIIEQPENRNLFGDWITKMRSRPELQTAKRLRDRKEELAVIQIRKEMKDFVQQIDNATQLISSIKDKIINERNEKVKRQLFEKMSSQLSIINDLLYRIDDRLTTNTKFNLLRDAIRTKVSAQVQNMIHRVDLARYNEDNEENRYDNELISDITKLKQAVASLPGLIDQYVVYVEQPT